MTTAVIGAGIAGLAAARRITQAGGEAVVFEAEDRVGGRIQTIKRDGRTFDCGAFIYLGSYAQSTAMMRELGLQASMARVPAYGAMPRGGKLHYLDFGGPVRTVGATKYLSAPNKARLAKLMVKLGRHWKDLNYEDASGVARIDTDTVEEWCRHELNRELLDYVAAVVVRGRGCQTPATPAWGSCCGR